MTTTREPIEERKNGAGCLKIAGIGCALLLGVVLLSVVVIMFNLDNIRESDWYQRGVEGVESAKTEMQNMLALREDLSPDYPAGEIKISANISSGDGQSRRTLTLHFVNPEFELPGESQGREAKAREIALRVAERYPDLSKYDTLSISFDDGNAIMTESEDHEFDVEELLENR